MRVFGDVLFLFPYTTFVVLLSVLPYTVIYYTLGDKELTLR